MLNTAKRNGDWEDANEGEMDYLSTKGVEGRVDADQPGRRICH